jgi:tetratricopeptide (TPR) repeat protein
MQPTGSAKCPNCGSPRQAGLEDCPACGIVFRKYTHSSAHKAVGGSRRRRSSKGNSAVKKVFGCGCGCFVIVIGVLAAVFFVLLNLFKTSDSYIRATAFVRQCEQVQELVGEPMEFGFLPTGNISTSAGESTAEFAIPVKGPEGKTRVQVSMVETDDEWEVLGASFIDASGNWALVEIYDPMVEIDAMRQLSAESSAEALAEGIRLVDDEQYAEAMTQFDRAISADTQNGEAYLQRGYLWATQQQPGLAIDDLERAADMGYDGVDVRDKLGLLSYQQEDWPGCVAQLSRSIGMAPENAWAFEMRARCRFSQGDVDRAKEDAKSSCDLGNEEGCRMLRNMR